MRFFVIKATSNNIADNAILSKHVAADVLAAADIAADAITSSELADNAVDAAAIASDAVTTAKILDANVTTAKIADDAVTLAKMAAGTAGGMPIYDASGNPADSGAGTSGQVLTSNGAGAAASWQAASGGGDATNLLFTSLGTSGTITYAGNSGLGAVTNCKVDVALNDVSAEEAIIVILEIIENGAGQTNEYEVEVNGTSITTTKFIDESNSPIASIKKGVHYCVIIPHTSGTDDVLSKERAEMQDQSSVNANLDVATAEFTTVALADWMTKAHTWQVNARNNGSATATKYALTVYKMSIEAAMYLINGGGLASSFPNYIYNRTAALDKVREL